MSLAIRHASAADMAQLAAQEAELTRYPWSAQQYAGSLAAGHRFFLLCDGTAILAWAVVMVVLDEAELLNIATNRAHQRQGHASNLLRQLIDTLAHAQCRVLRLEVRSGNTAARQLYQRLGFRDSGLRKGYYRAEHGREDAVLMEIAPCPAA